MSYDGRLHEVSIGGITRQLPLFQVAPNVTIAIFNMLGDTEIVEAAAKALAKKIPVEANVLIVPEVKAVPLGHALSVYSGLPYVVVRKFRKPYMVNCVSTEVVSITVDDVVSTGSTLRGLHKLMNEAEANIVSEMAVFTEGNEEEWSNITALGHLPLFTD